MAGFCFKQYVARKSSDVFSIQDDDHISLVNDADVLLLQRIKVQE